MQMLEIDVFDHDRFQSHDLLGRLRVPVGRLVDAGSSSWELDRTGVALSPNKPGPSSISVASEYSDLKDCSWADADVLICRIHGARGIPLDCIEGAVLSINATTKWGLGTELVSSPAWRQFWDPVESLSSSTQTFVCELHDKQGMAAEDIAKLAQVPTELLRIASYFLQKSNGMPRLLLKIHLQECA